MPDNRLNTFLSVLLVAVAVTIPLPPELITVNALSPAVEDDFVLYLNSQEKLTPVEVVNFTMAAFSKDFLRFFYHEIFFFKRRLWKNYELLEWFLSRAFLGVIVYLGIQYGFIGYIMNFWFVPALVVGIALGLFFDYLPHRPFEDRDRWKNARVYPSKLLNLMILGQNYHLVHHLWP